MSSLPRSDSEAILWRGSISHWHYTGAWLVIFALLGGIAASFLVPAAANWIYVWPLRAGLAAVMLILSIAIALDRRKRTYTVTDQRVIVEFGVVSKQSNEVRVQDIRSINLRMEGLKAFFGVGRVEFSSAATDDAEVVFWNTPQAERVRDLVRNLQAKASHQSLI